MTLKLKSAVEVELTEDLREENYEDYEDLTIEQIGDRRKANGFDKVETGTWEEPAVKGESESCYEDLWEINEAQAD